MMTEGRRLAGSDAASLYGAYYYQTGCGRPYTRDEHWLPFFDGIAAKIVERIAPKKVLDAGCALGLLVEGLRKRNVEADGIDVSEFAIQEVHESVRPYCRVQSVTAPLETEYDLIVCIEVLEHLQPEEAEEAVGVFCRAAPRVLFSSTPTDFFEATHFNVRSPEYWAELFARQGFFRDVDFDGSFITPWCALFCKEDLLPARVVARYERRLWHLFQEIKGARDIALDQRSRLEEYDRQTKDLNAQVADLEQEQVRREIAYAELLSRREQAFARELAEQVQHYSRLAADAEQTSHALAQQVAETEVRLRTEWETRLRVEGDEREHRGREDERARAVAAWQRLAATNQMLSQRLLSVTDQLHASQRQAECLSWEKHLIWEQMLRESNQARALGHQLATLTSTKAWRFTTLCQRLRHRVAPRGSLRSRALRLSWKALRVWRCQGTWAVVRRSAGKVARKLGLRHAPQPLHPDAVPFTSEPASPARPVAPPTGPQPLPMTHLGPRQATQVLANLPSHPLVSIVVPAYRVPVKWLDLCIRSVVEQYYPNWELIVVDDHSEDPAMAALLREWSARDTRIRVLTLEENRGIVGATNPGIDMASGSFIAFLDADDELTPDALTWVVAMHNRYPEAVWFYSDEDKLDPDGNHVDTFHKPDFSPEYLLCSMYTCHFSVYASELVRSVGGLRPEFNGSQDHDLALRLSDIISRDQVIHIPRVLYHWRMIPGSGAQDQGVKPYAAEAGIKAVRDALQRRGVNATVQSHPHAPTLYRVTFHPQRTPHVTIIIPTRNAVDLVRACVNSIYAHTHYPSFDVVVIDNQSDDPALFAYLQDEEARGRLRTFRYDRPFNHSAMNNAVVESVESEFVVFMNNDIEMLTDGWLEQLVGTTELDPTIAGVGALLLHDDRTVQHAGVILGLNGVSGHAHRAFHENDFGYFSRLQCLQDFSACTAALLLMRRMAFLSVGGFRVERYPNSLNDVDLWFRLRDAGFRCLYNPCVKGIHFESKTRTIRPEIEGVYQQRLREEWGDRLWSDPFYNPNLALDNEQFRGIRPYPVEADFPELAGPAREAA
jgi:glycosyltransferase involved in cell wall biosynthesis